MQRNFFRLGVQCSVWRASIHNATILLVVCLCNTTATQRLFLLKWEARSRYNRWFQESLFNIFFQGIIFLHDIWFTFKRNISRQNNIFLFRKFGVWCVMSARKMKDPVFLEERISSYICVRRSQYPRGLRRRFAAARSLRSWVRIPPRAWMFDCWVLCVVR